MTMTDISGAQASADKKQPDAQVSGRPIRAWPVLLLALPAFVAIWSGWVGLGGLTGFGPVRPLPGIADEFTINTAITLPIGMEAYASYALSVWLSGRVRSDRTRGYAKWSAFGSLILGAVGQVVYHLMQAADVTVAPWPVTVLVACLPVLVLGMGAALAHMILREHHHPATPFSQQAEPVPGGAQPLLHDSDPVMSDGARTVAAPLDAPGSAVAAPGGAPRPTDAPPPPMGVMRTHRRVPRARRVPRRRPPVRTIRPRSEQVEAGVVPDQRPSAPIPEPGKSNAGQPVPADRDELIHELTARGMSARQIGPLIGVAHTTVLRVLGRTENAPVDAPQECHAPADAPAAPVPVRNLARVRRGGLRTAPKPVDEPGEVIDAELVEDTELSITEHPADSGTVAVGGGA
ncbi:helix-turn-helix domain-containing protein [Nocardia sp. CS682]|uniref:helix-turn-helix domain-containing protein n=1 Tax=Nocardia sp. CS682 TaxID=1047172 RepID=UPI00197E303F|nr:helix-turn-helix domain-containing protein [Nocardia sp. CS682]